jgi:hypothetical protein
MRAIDFQSIAGVIAIHAERRDQYRAVDADGVHGGRHLVAGNLRRPVESADPGASRVVAFVGVNLGIQCRRDFLHGTDVVQERYVPLPVAISQACLQCRIGTLRCAALAFKSTI